VFGYKIVFYLFDVLLGCPVFLCTLLYVFFSSIFVYNSTRASPVGIPRDIYRIFLYINILCIFICTIGFFIFYLFIFFLLRLLLLLLFPVIFLLKQ
jgi:hypothetical protein